MKSLGNGAYALERTVGARGFLVSVGTSLILIDPGMRAGLGGVTRELKAQGFSPYQVTDLLLTHYDFDHSQGVADWAARTEARTWIGAADAAILQGRTPPPPTVLRRALALVGLPRLPGKVTLLEGDDEIVGGIRAVATPGHTPGHFVYVFGDLGFIGDTALVSAGGTLRRLPWFLDADPAEAATARAKVATLGIRTYCAGHSAPATRV